MVKLNLLFGSIDFETMEDAAQFTALVMKKFVDLTQVPDKGAGPKYPFDVKIVPFNA